MEPYFKTNLILREELDYELRIRGVITDRPVIDKRKMLSRILDKERSSKIDVLKLVDPNFNFDREKVEISATIESIKNLIVDFEGPSSDSVYLRAQARIAHLSRRIQRLSGEEDADKSKVEFRNEAFASVMLLDADLNDKVKEPELSMGASINASSSPNGNTSQLLPDDNNFPSQSSFYGYHKPTVHTLNISFEGNPKNVMSFIERVEELARSRNITKAELFQSASELFTDKALFWLRQVKPSVKDWDSLIMKLKADFLSSDIDEIIWRQIKDRKQTKSEPVVLYGAVMQGLLDRLSNKPAERTRVKYILKGLHKEYQQRLALHDIETVDQLTKLCRRLEEADVLSHASTSNVHQVFGLNENSDTRDDRSSHFHGGSRQKRFEDYRRRPQPQVKNLNDTGEEKNKNLKNITCWKCGGSNHLFRNCRSKTSKRFCFKCGTPDVTKKTCENCSGNAE